MSPKHTPYLPNDLTGLTALTGLTDWVRLVRLVRSVWVALVPLPLAKKHTHSEFESSTVRCNSSHINDLQSFPVSTHVFTHVSSRFQALNRALPTT